MGFGVKPSLPKYAVDAPLICRTRIQYPRADAAMAKRCLSASLIP
jgi:hypothetical protein